jgi:hypothetical protein
MTREGSRSERLVGRRYCVLFDYVAEGGRESAGASKKLKDVRLGVPSRTTVSRTLAVAVGLYERIDPLADLTQDDVKNIRYAGYHPTRTSIDNAFEVFKEWLLGDRHQSKKLPHGHVDLLLMQAVELRKYLTEPDLFELPDDRELLTISGKDWRLDPIMWFHLCTPDLKNKDAWGATFRMLLEHLEGSQFLKDYASLRQAVGRLEQDYNRAAIQLDAEARASWLDIQTEKAMREKTSVPLPLRHPGASDASMDRSPPYEPCLCKKMIREFSKVMKEPPLWMRLRDLEKQLKKLSLDLDPHEVWACIEKSHCSDCGPE